MVVSLAGVGYLLVQGVNPLDATGTGVLSHLGADTLGNVLVDGAQKAGSALPQGYATGNPGLV